MADKENLIGNPEFEALKEIQDVDPQKLMEQAGLVDPPETPPVETPPVVTGTTPVTMPVTLPVDTGTPPVMPVDTGAPTPEQQAIEQRKAVLKEIFGDRFNTVDEAKSANIPGILTEVNDLRQAKTDLESKLQAKPKTDFADEEVQLYNVFVKETGIKDFGVFSKIHKSDVANMDPLDALVTKHVMENPGVSFGPEKLRRMFEKKYGVDPDLEGDEDNDFAMMKLQTDAAKAKTELKEVKDKLIVPEATYEEPTVKQLTDEQKATLSQGWNSVGSKVIESLSKLNVPIKNKKDPLMTYEISEVELQEIQKFITGYAVENQMELNKENVQVVSTMVYNQLMLNKMPEIVHSVFEKARSMTEEQVHALYENPSPARNTDQPPATPSTELSDEEKLQEDIFDAEMGRYNE
jgi:hypothetical protein